MKSSKPGTSAGLTFMRAAHAAMPRTLGDRQRISAMSVAMGLAVKNRFAFDPADAEDLQRMSIETCVGVFRPLDLIFYREACYAGGTYARLWEKFEGIKPWTALKAVFSAYQHDTHVKDCVRVCPHVAVLMPPSFGPLEKGLAEWEGMQVWWCTAFTNETINLCRYEAGTNRFDSLKKCGGSPARRRKLTREEWFSYQEVMKLHLGLLPEAGLKSVDASAESDQAKGDNPVLLAV